jgi:hypothetical protein
LWEDIIPEIVASLFKLHVNIEGGHGVKWEVTHKSILKLLLPLYEKINYEGGGGLMLFGRLVKSNVDGIPVNKSSRAYSDVKHVFENVVYNELQEERIPQEKKKRVRNKKRVKDEGEIKEEAILLKSPATVGRSLGTTASVTGVQRTPSSTERRVIGSNPLGSPVGVHRTSSGSEKRSIDGSIGKDRINNIAHEAKASVVTGARSGVESTGHALKRSIEFKQVAAAANDNDDDDDTYDFSSSGIGRNSGKTDKTSTSNATSFRHVAESKKDSDADDDDDDDDDDDVDYKFEEVADSEDEQQGNSNTVDYNDLQMDELDSMFLSSFGVGRGPPPNKFVCCISGEIMREPVRNPYQGKYEEIKWYDRCSLLELVGEEEGDNVWPGTKRKIEGEDEIFDLRVNEGLRREIEDWQRRQGA